jgi:hypothetical protein
MGADSHILATGLTGMGLRGARLWTNLEVDPLSLRSRRGAL